MKSRDRVLAAFDHYEPDKVPLDFGSHRSSGISASLYTNLKKALGIQSGDNYVYDIVQQLAIIETPVLDALGADVIELGRNFLLKEENWYDWVLPDGTPCKIPYFINLESRDDDVFIISQEGIDLAVLKKGALFFRQIYFPYENRNFENCDYDDLNKIFNKTMWTGAPSVGTHFDVNDEKSFRELKQGAKQLRELEDRAIVGIFGGNMFEVPQFLYGDKYFLYMGLYPDECLHLSEVLFNEYSLRLERYLDAVGDYIDIIVFADDLGGQTGPLMSKEMYRKYYKPYHAKLWRRAKEKSGVKVMLHSCGGIEPLLNDLIDAGLDAFNPVQITCNGMDPEYLKKEYGKRILFWGGGCDTRDILPKGTPEIVRQHTKKQINTFSPDGGFVFQQVHNIMPEVPIENVLAMFNSFQEVNMI